MNQLIVAALLQNINFSPPSVNLPLIVDEQTRSAARRLSGADRWSHITPTLSFLHWLPVTHRTQLKMLTLTYPSLHHQVPSYLWNGNKKTTDLISSTGTDNHRQQLTISYFTSTLLPAEQDVSLCWAAWYTDTDTDTDTDTEVPTTHQVRSTLQTDTLFPWTCRFCFPVLLGSHPAWTW